MATRATSPWPWTTPSAPASRPSPTRSPPSATPKNSRLLFKALRAGGADLDSPARSGVPRHLPSHPVSQRRGEAGTHTGRGNRVPPLTHHPGRGARTDGSRSETGHAFKAFTPSATQFKDDLPLLRSYRHHRKPVRPAQQGHPPEPFGLAQGVQHHGLAE